MQNLKNKIFSGFKNHQITSLKIDANVQQLYTDCYKTQVRKFNKDINTGQDTMYMGHKSQ